MANITQADGPEYINHQVNLLSSNNQETAGNAAGVLALMMQNHQDGAVTIAHADNSISNLVNLLSSNNQVTAGNAAEVLARMMQNYQDCAATIADTDNSISNLVDLLSSDNQVTIEHAARALVLLMLRKPGCAAVIATTDNSISNLVKVLSSDNQVTIEHAARALVLLRNSKKGGNLLEGVNTSYRELLNAAEKNLKKLNCIETLSPGKSARKTHNALLKKGIFSGDNFLRKRSFHLACTSNKEDYIMEMGMIWLLRR